MRQRGRKSTAQLAVVPIKCEAQRPPPPADLTQDQAKIWRDVVATTPAGWFREGDVLLGLYCRHVHTANVLAGIINSFSVEDCEMQQLNRLLTMRERETRMLTHLATKMRLTPQARISPRSAGRQMESAGSRRPWEDD